MKYTQALWVLLLCFLMGGKASAVTFAEIPAADLPSAFTKRLTHTLRYGRPDSIKPHPADPDLAFVSTSDGYILLLNLCTGTPVWSVRAHEIPSYIPDLTISGSGRFVMTNDPMSKVKVFRGDDGALLQEFQFPRGEYRELPKTAFSHDEQYLFATNHRSIHKIDIASGNVDSVFTGQFYSSDVVALGLLPSGNPFILTQQNGLLIWDPETLQPVFSQRLDPQPSWFRDSEIFGGRYLASKSSWLGFNIGLIDVRNPSAQQIFIGHTRQPTDLTLTADLRWSFTSSYDSTIRVWETRTGRLLRTTAATTSNHELSMVYSLAVDPSGDVIVVGLDQSEIAIYDQNEGFGRVMCR